MPESGHSVLPTPGRLQAAQLMMNPHTVGSSTEKPFPHTHMMLFYFLHNQQLTSGVMRRMSSMNKPV